MSPRQNVDQQRIRAFFQQLARVYHGPARIYLVGGTSLVFEDLRDQTIDIDVALDVSPADHAALIRAIRELKDTLQTNVEEASPGDFIPLPSGYDRRHQFIERYGQIDLFHFDLYSTALSKISRGRTQDYEDVLALLSRSKITWEQLRECFDEILPHVGERSLKQNPEEFQENFQTLRDLWNRQGGNA